MSHPGRLLVLVLLLLAGTIRPVHAEKRVALVVGNSAYLHTTPLRNPVNDAKDLSVALQNLGFDVITAIDARAEQFDGALKQFAERLSGADVALFFYAGHGVQFSGRNYLVPVDARLTDEFSLKREATAADDVVQLLETGARVNLMFLDACRNNPLAEQLKRSTTSSIRAAQIGRGLARMETSGGDTLITFSTAPGDVANDGSGRNSPFTDALLRHIKSPGIDVEVMLKRVTEDVRNATKDRQRPERLSKLSKEFAFSPVQQKRTDAATNVGNSNEELSYWNSVKDSQDKQLFERYLQRYPNGVFAAIARAKIHKLAEPSNQPQPKRDPTIAYHETIAIGTPEALRAFVEEFPDDPHSARIRELIAAKSDEDAWKRASSADTSAAYRNYLTAFPTGIYMDNARRRMAAFEEQERQALVASSPQPQSMEPVAVGQRSYWNHNGSLMYLVADGDLRRFFYEQPRAGMRGVGARRGTLLFEGRKRGDTYSGTAYIFTAHCGAFPYAVSGVVSDNQRRVTMYGNAPTRISSDCRVGQYRRDELIFDYEYSN